MYIKNLSKPGHSSQIQKAEAYTQCCHVGKGRCSLELGTIHRHIDSWIYSGQTCSSFQEKVSVVLEIKNPKVWPGHRTSSVTKSFTFIQLIVIESPLCVSLSQVLNSECTINLEPIANPTNAKIRINIHLDDISPFTIMETCFLISQYYQALCRQSALSKDDSNNTLPCGLPWNVTSSIPRCSLIPLYLGSRLDVGTSVQAEEHKGSDSIWQLRLGQKSYASSTRFSWNTCFPDTTLWTGPLGALSEAQTRWRGCSGQPRGSLLLKASPIRH